MNNLRNFTNNILSKEETAIIKGGIRFITTSHTEYKAKRRELMRNNISFTEEVHHGNNRFYCIEW